MANQLTHALVAASIMALINPVLGREPISWNIFLAAFIAMALNLDCSSCRIFSGSPGCNSLACGIFISYVALVIAYFGHAFWGWGLGDAMTGAVAMAVGFFGRLVGEFLTGSCIFTFPIKQDVGCWLCRYDEKTERFWGGWGRARLDRLALGDSHLNGLSLAVILLSIGLF